MLIILLLLIIMFLLSIRSYDCCEKGNYNMPGHAAEYIKSEVDILLLEFVRLEQLGDIVVYVIIGVDADQRAVVEQQRVAESAARLEGVLGFLIDDDRVLIEIDVERSARVFPLFRRVEITGPSRRISFSTPQLF